MKINPEDKKLHSQQQDMATYINSEKEIAAMKKPKNIHESLLKLSQHKLPTERNPIEAVQVYLIRIVVLLAVAVGLSLLLLLITFLIGGL